MNCEHVRELLSAYLDDALASDDHRVVAAHLETCSDCSAILADYRRFDALLSHHPRVRPDPSVRATLFSSPEYLELTGTSGRRDRTNEETLPLPARRADDMHRPHLISLPGGRLRSSEKPTVLMPVPSSTRRHRRFSTQRLMYVAIAATLLLTFSISGLIGWRLWQQPESALHPSPTFTPPAAPHGSQAPIPAGIRFVFLRGGALWSAPTDGSRAIARLTPEQVSVAEHWTVRNPLPGRPAGNLLAYIDLHQGYVHIIRSDGQSDTAIQQPLLRTNPAQVWKTETGSTILNSLSWSPDGSKLAFVADPEGTNTPGLYIYTAKTGSVEKAPLPVQGAVSHPIWSPDSVNIAFTFTQNGKTDILDYNINNHNILTIVSAAQVQGDATESAILTFAWLPATEKLTLTWSVGTDGHIQSIWQKEIQADAPHALIEGEFTEALYNSAGNGRWLVVNGRSNQPGNITTIDFQGNRQQLTSNKRASFVQWSPDAKYIAYFDTVLNNLGQFHLLDVTTGIDILVAPEAATQPSPVWSPNSQQLAYSTGNHVLVVDVRNSKTSQPLKLQGAATTITWSAHTPDQLVLVMGDTQPGIYLVDTKRDTSLLLDPTGITGPVLWTLIP